MDVPLSPLTLEACSEKETFKNDWINELPDDILIHILSFVTMKEAGRTSLLSKRWRYVWAYIRNLNFNTYDELDQDFLYNEYTESLEETESKYVCWVDQVVNSHKAPIIDVFKVKYDLGFNRNDNIDNWLGFALEKRVKKLELDVAPFAGGYGWLGDQKLSYTCPSLPFCNSMTFLKLVCVHVTGELVEKLLTGCPTLEFLSVASSNLLVDLKVSGPSLNLKSLSILYCNEIKHLEISAPNLEFLNYNGPIIGSPFKSIPKLVELSIGGDYAIHIMSDFVDLSSFISQIEVLTIQSRLLFKSVAEVFPICTRVKTLDIMINLRCDEQFFRLRFLLNVCPCLQKFVLKFNISCEEILRSEKTLNVEACPHYQLKIFEIIKFVGWDIDTAFVKYMIDSAVSLEEVIIEPTKIGTSDERCVATRRKRAIEMAEKLRLQVRPGTSFQIRE